MATIILRVCKLYISVMHSLVRTSYQLRECGMVLTKGVVNVLSILWKLWRQQKKQMIKKNSESGSWCVVMLSTG